MTTAKRTVCKRKCSKTARGVGGHTLEGPECPRGHRREEMRFLSPALRPPPPPKRDRPPQKCTAPVGLGPDGAAPLTTVTEAPQAHGHRAPALHVRPRAPPRPGPPGPSGATATRPLRNGAAPDGAAPPPPPRLGGGGGRWAAAQGPQDAFPKGRRGMRVPLPPGVPLPMPPPPMPHGQPHPPSSSGGRAPAQRPPAEAHMIRCGPPQGHGAVPWGLLRAPGGAAQGTWAWDGAGGGLRGPCPAAVEEDGTGALHPERAPAWGGPQ